MKKLLKYCKFQVLNQSALNIFAVNRGDMPESR
jgi:hypothetical protein